MIIFGVSVKNGGTIYSKIWNKLKTYYDGIENAKPASIRGCKHELSNSKFCADCGAPIWKENKKYYINEDICMFEICDIITEWYPGLELHGRNDSDAYILGYEANTLEGNILTMKSNLRDLITEQFGVTLKLSNIKFHSTNEAVYH